MIFYQGCMKTVVWGISSVGRAPALQAGGHEFESRILHYKIGIQIGKDRLQDVSLVFFSLPIIAGGNCKNIASYISKCMIK